MTEKGTVIHSAGSKCEPRLQGQSTLMLQERKWSFARSERNFLFSFKGNTRQLDKRIVGEGKFILVLKYKVFMIPLSPKRSGISYIDEMILCEKSVSRVSYDSTWYTFSSFLPCALVITPNNSLVDSHSEIVNFYFH